MNLFGGAWAGLMIVLATPWYVSQLGLSGYGIVGVWLMMQVMMGLLDMGVGATLVRGFASAKADAGGLEFKRDLLRTLEVVYWGIAIALSLLLVLAAGWIGQDWLRLDAIPAASVDGALKLMAVALGLQFPCALYLSGLNGLQCHARMNIMQIIGNTLRYGAGAVVLLWRADLVWFFAVQILVAAVQTFVTRKLVWSQISPLELPYPVFRLTLLRQVRRFSAGMALTSICAVLLANADRIVLGNMVTTEDLGKYSVAFSAAGLLQLGIQPFYRTYFPRYAELVSLGGGERLRSEYFYSCRMMAIFLVPLGVMGFTFAPDLLYAWLGKRDDAITTTFRLLVVGITCSGLAWLPAAFQQAHGLTRLHALMMAGAALIGVPVMVPAILEFGIAGGAAVWLLHGFSDVTLGLWLMHRRLLPGELSQWYRSVLLIPLLVAVPFAIFSDWLMPQEHGRWGTVVWVAFSGLVSVALLLWWQARGALVASSPIK